MKLLLVTALGLGLVMLGKKLLGNRTFKPLAALPSSEREHSEEELIQISPAPIH
ncbi:hypothetical protein [Deinococcus cellulosilyticus]|uniref:Uncharacterized protein n=1 Tax=Deinococcus cellulosilyticus (strain DSM 18568 / NBRC 106333 / KACC 11606 / 5516J-15) TaxID=1223518 RepID=A0A511N5F5_DEIC1|nr:hypothetical protein [Deinococcus cellulosilyticus]GEM48085.1 hypothetical protein DC3_37200 [Deinococcus cellulosilyticus NBRC 106333 = KACC 11606]